MEKTICSWHNDRIELMKIVKREQNSYYVIHNQKAEYPIKESQLKAIGYRYQEAVEILKNNENKSQGGNGDVNRTNKC